MRSNANPLRAKNRERSLMKSIAVIGAGITGVTTAWKLMRRGVDVTLIDANPYAAMETSFANGGQLSASNAEVWNSLGTVFKGMKWMLSSNAPLLVNPRPSWHKYSWMAEFLAQIPHYERNTVQTAKMAVAARSHLLAMADEAGLDFNLEKRGILHVYRDEKSFRTAEKVTTLLAKGGVNRAAVSPMDIRKLEPALQGSLYAGFYTQDDMTGDIHRFSAGLADALRSRGVKMRLGERVTKAKVGDHGVDLEFKGVDAPSIERFSSVVVCAGVASRDLAAMFGDRVNIYPVKGYSITVNMDDQASQDAAPWVSLLDDDAKLVTSRLGKNRFRVAGTAEFNGTNKDIRADRIQPLIDWTRDLFPGLSTEYVTPWAGLRPMMPNMMPRVGQGRSERVFYNTGHGHLGWTLSAVTADMVAELMVQRPARAADGLLTAAAA
ncbi:MAG: D-amino acid dehydrogenase [Pseudomonadota bacterium]